MHMKIVTEQLEGGGVRYILGQFSQPFSTIPLMIHNYTVNKLPIKGAEHTCLLYPVGHELLWSLMPTHTMSVANCFDLLCLFTLCPSLTALICYAYPVDHELLWFTMSTLPCQSQIALISMSTSGRGTVVSIVSCWCTYCCLETSYRRITRHYSRSVLWHFATCASVNCYTYILVMIMNCIHTERNYKYRIGCVGSCVVLVKAIT